MNHHHWILGFLLALLAGTSAAQTTFTPDWWFGDEDPSDQVNLANLSSFADVLQRPSQKAINSMTPVRHYWQVLSTNTADANDYAPATVGQALFMAHAALVHIFRHAPYGEQSSELQDKMEAVHDAFETFRTKFDDAWIQTPGSTPPTYYSQFPPTLTPINVGQLKNLADPYYILLTTKDANGEGLHYYESLNDIVNSNTSARKTISDPGDLESFDVSTFLASRGYEATSTRPWTIEKTPANYAPATIGQLKMVFSFSLSGESFTKDSDGDGIIDLFDPDPDNSSINEALDITIDYVSGAN